MEGIKAITVFEHQSLRVGEHPGFEQAQLESLQRFHSGSDFPYYTLIHRGVKFTEYVGVIQVGRLLIEVLPKADQHNDQEKWRKLLIGMIRAAGLYNIASPTESRLKLKPNAVLSLYFERFVSELEQLLHRGLAKKYVKAEGNLSSFKGRLIFSKHFQQNHIHQERVYVAYTVFSRDHALNRILYKALELLQHLNTDSALRGRIAALRLAFPETTDVRVTPRLFERIVLTRNTQHYKVALDIARMLLLNYHPDVSSGKNDVLALMFNMNTLWERFVLASLKRHLRTSRPSFEVHAQYRKDYWKPEGGYRTTIRPDILLQSGNRRFVLDTKWKNLDNTGIAATDLHQLFVYYHYFNSEKVAILYPGVTGTLIKGFYLDHENGEPSNKECSLIPVMVGQNITNWQGEIGNQVVKWMNRYSNVD